MSEPAPQRSMTARAWAWLVRTFVGDEIADQLRQDQRRR